MTTRDQLLAQQKERAIYPRINFELPEQMKTDLKAYANANKTTVAKVVKAMIALHLYGVLTPKVYKYILMLGQARASLRRATNDDQRTRAQVDLDKWQAKLDDFIARRDNVLNEAA